MSIVHLPVDLYLYRLTDRMNITDLVPTFGSL